MAMPYNSPDFLRPIRDANRDEHILVEFHRVLKNTNMSLVYNLISAAVEDETIIQFLPGLADYTKKSLDELYDMTVLYNYPHEMIRTMSRDKLSVELCTQYANAFATPYNMQMLHTTRMEGVIRNLLKTNFVKTLYIFAPHFNEEMKMYIARMFYDQQIGVKVICLEGNYEECLLDHPEITTVFQSNISDLVSFAQFYPDSIQKRFFVIADGYFNVEPTKVGKGAIYINLDFLSKLIKNKVCEIAFAYPHSIPKNPDVELGRKDETQ